MTPPKAATFSGFHSLKKDIHLHRFTGVLHKTHSLRKLYAENKTYSLKSISCTFLNYNDNTFPNY